MDCPIAVGNVVIQFQKLIAEKRVSKYAVVELSSQPLRCSDSRSKPRADSSVSTNVKVLMAPFFKCNQLEN